MGFFSDLGNALAGKQAAPQDDEPQSDMPEAKNGLVDESGRKIIPHIILKDLRSQRQGDKKLIVKTWIVNESEQSIRIDTSHLLKQTHQHNQQLGPNESRELTLYEGEIPDNENEHEAYITYRLQVNGDVFKENYRIDYHIEPDGKHIVNNLVGDGIVQDV